jgi:dTDP-4-dehydrorhamnose reductase
MIRQSTLTEDPPLPLLITGIAGVAGFNAFHYFRERFPGQVIGTRRADNWPLRGEGIEGCDAEDYDGFADLFERYRFQGVLNCEGTCKLKSCELDPAMAQRVNVLGVSNLLKLAGQYSARLVHLSIDLVFSGLGEGGHVEGDATDPVTVYGRTMVEAEERVLAADPSACLLRISLPMGISHNGHAGAIDWIQSRFMKSKPATLYFDEVRTPTYTDCLNRLLQQVLTGDLNGLYHAGGPRRLSLYEIAQIVNRIGGYAPEHLMGCYRQEAGPVPPRAGNVSMNSDKLTAAIGFEPFDPWPYCQDHVPTHRDWHCERRASEPGSPELLAEVLYRNPNRQEKIGEG